MQFWTTILGGSGDDGGFALLSGVLSSSSRLSVLARLLSVNSLVDGGLLVSYLVSLSSSSRGLVLGVCSSISDGSCCFLTFLLPRFASATGLAPRYLSCFISLFIVRLFCFRTCEVRQYLLAVFCYLALPSSRCMYWSCYVIALSRLSLCPQSVPGLASESLILLVICLPSAFFVLFLSFRVVRDVRSQVSFRGAASFLFSSRLFPCFRGVRNAGRRYFQKIRFKLLLSVVCFWISGPLETLVKIAFEWFVPLSLSFLCFWTSEPLETRVQVAFRGSALSLLSWHCFPASGRLVRQYKHAS